MKLSIITLNFRKPELTKACMVSLYGVYKQQFENGEFELIIVDNFSEDDSVAVITEEIHKKKYKNFTLLANKKNAGFGAGNNYGARKAKADYLLFLNNDTVVKSGLDKMVDYMDLHQDIAVLGGPLKNFDGSSQSSAGVFYTPVRALMLLLGLQKYGLLDKNPKHIEKVDWVKGALLMIRKQVFEQLKGFDEHIFMYTEDMELCYRAKLAGHDTYFFPDVFVLHKDQGSSNRTFAIVNIYRNLAYFYKKHRSASEYVYLLIFLKTKAYGLIIWGKIVHNLYLVNTYEEAVKTI